MIEIREETAYNMLHRRIKKLQFSNILSISSIEGDLTKNQPVVITQVNIIRLKTTYWGDFMKRIILIEKIGGKDIFDMFYGQQYELGEEGIGELLIDILAGRKQIAMDMMSLAEAGINAETIEYRVVQGINLIFNHTFPQKYREAFYMFLFADRLPMIETISELLARSSRQLERYREEKERTRIPRQM